MVDSKVAEGFVELTIDTATLTRGLSRAQKSITGSLRNIQRGADRAGKALSIALTAPLLAAGIASGKVAGTFELNLAKIVGLVGVASDEVAKFGDEILQLAPQVGRGPAELAEALFFITSAGKRGADALETLTASAKAATAGLGSTAIVADAATSATNAFAGSNLSATQAVAILVKTVREGKAAADEIAGSLGQVTGIAAELGISFDQLGAAIAAMTRTGVSAAEAVTQLRSIFTALLTPGSQAETALAKLGLSFEDLRRQLREEGLLAVLTTLRDEIGDDSAALAEIIPNVRALTGVLGLVGGSAEQTRAIFKSLSETTEDDLDIAFRAVADTGAFKFIQAMVGIQTAATQLGQVILPILAPVITKITAAIITAGNAFAELAPAMQETILTGLALGAALGPALIIFGLMVGAIINVIGALKVVATGFIILSSVALKSIGLILGAIFSIPGLIAIAAASIFLFRDTIVEVFKSIGTIISGTFEIAFEPLTRIVANTINGIIEQFNSLQRFFGREEISFRIQAPTDESLQEVRENVASALEFRATKDQFVADIDGIRAGIKTSFEAIKNILAGAIDIPGFDALANKFPELAGKFKDSIAELNKSISSNFDETLKKLQDGIGNLESKTKSTADSIEKVLTDVSGTISSSITGVVTGATSALDALRNVANAIISSIISSIIGAPGGGGFLGSLFGSAKGNVFSGGAPVPFVDGGLISGRTTFPMTNGGVGLAGEAGNEAIFPLTRVAGGGLGISAEGVSNDNVVITQINNFTPDVRATVREEIANAAPLLINASKQATIAALNGRRV